MSCARIFSRHKHGTLTFAVSDMDSSLKFEALARNVRDLVGNTPGAATIPVAPKSVCILDYEKTMLMKLPLMGSLLRSRAEDGTSYYYVPHSRPLTTDAAGFKLRISRDGQSFGTRYCDKAMLLDVTEISLGAFPGDGVASIGGVDTTVELIVDPSGRLWGMSLDPALDGETELQMEDALEAFDSKPQWREWWVTERPTNQRDADDVSGLRADIGGLDGFDGFLAHMGAPDPRSVPSRRWCAGCWGKAARASRSGWRALKAQFTCPGRWRWRVIWASSNSRCSR